MILLENAEQQKKMLEKRCEDMAQRLRDSEKVLTNAQKEIANYQVLVSLNEGLYPGNYSLYYMEILYTLALFHLKSW